jgi:hypothetical protein
MPRKILTATKLEWYEKLGFGIARDDPNAATVGINHTDGYGGMLTEESERGRKAREDLGAFASLPAHVTLHRTLWSRKFRPGDDTDVIMERIFGSGQLSVHVSLEEEGLPKAPRVYWKGQNFGRDERERNLLSEMLTFYVLRARDILVGLQKRYDEFVWPDSDDPLEKLIWEPSDLFDELAALATRKTGANVVCPTQKDAALLWSAAAVHPLQALQNTYQRLVREASRDIVDDEARKTKEGDELGKFCYFESSAPRLMAQPKGAAGGIAELLDKVEKDLAKVQRAAAEGAEDGSPISAAGRARATRALTDLLTVRAYYSNGAVKVPALEAADRGLAGMDVKISGALTWGDLDKVARALGRAHREMGRVYNGLCCIQNFHIIEPFYLFRLLVKFRIESASAIPSSKRIEVSGVLTSLLHNHARQAWLFNWLRDKLVELNRRLGAACGDNARFFLKGGRAAKYLVGLPTKGENDWDTQIIINPNLRAGAWYENFLKVHNLVLVFLQEAKAEFLVQCHEHANEFGAVVDEWRAQEAGADERREEDQTGEEIDALLTDLEMVGEMQADDAIGEVDAREVDDDEGEAEGEVQLDVVKENCKAELIDIGIPRRDTVEAFEQWEHFVPDLMVVEGMPIPGHLYYVAEYVMMIRDIFAGGTISLVKTPKRVMRLREVLVLPGLAQYIARERAHIPPPVLPASVPLVDGLPVAEKSVLTVLLKQFAEALDLDVDPGLALCFDTLFSANLGARKAKAKYPPALVDAIAKQAGYTGEYESLCDCIGYAQWVAEAVGKHMAGPRAKFMTEQRAVLGAFVKAIYTASIFSQEDDLEVRFAVAGSFAALLHAEYAEYDRIDRLDPLRRVDLKIYCKADGDPATVRELILPLVDQYLLHPQTTQFKVELHGEDAICLYWPAEVGFGEGFTYTPLVLKITVQKCDEDWPQLAFVRGFPVLALRDLVWEYKREAGHIEELFTQRRLKKAIECMVDMLTRFENPSAGPTWARPGIQNRVLGGPDGVPPPPPDDDGPGGEAPSKIIPIPRGADSMFAALARGATDRGLTGHTAQSLRLAVADEVRDRAYQRPIQIAIDALLDALPPINDARAAVAGAGSRIGDPALQECVEQMFRARQRGEQPYRWYDEFNAYQTALRGNLYLGSDFEAGIVGGILARGVVVHQADQPPTFASSTRDDDPIRLVFDGRDHYDVYRSGEQP